MNKRGHFFRKIGFTTLMSIMVSIGTVQAQTPVLGGFNSVSYTERSTPVLVSPTLTVSSGNSYSDGYIRYVLTNPQGTETLTLSNTAADPTTHGVISLDVDGRSVYLGQGSGNKIRIGEIDATENGENGSPLKINITFVREFTNPNFEDGLNGWTIDATRYYRQDELHGTEIPIKPSILGCIYTHGLIRIDPSSPGSGYSVTQVTTPVSNGVYSTKLTLSGSVPSTSGAPTDCREDAYSIFGPRIISNPFNAYTGDVFSIDWQAASGGDWYDVIGYLVSPGPDGNLGTTDDIRTTMFAERGDNTNGWRTNSTTIPANNTYQFEFVAGSYDRTGGTVLGATLYVDNLQLTSGSTIGVYDADMQTLARQITYHNAGCDPAASQNISVTVANGVPNSDTENATINITLVNCPPEVTITADNGDFLEGGSPVSIFSGADIATPEAVQSIAEIRLTFSGMQDGVQELIKIDNTTLPLANGSGTTTTNSIHYLISGNTITLTRTGHMTATMAENLLNGLSYQNSKTAPTTGVRTFTLTYISDNGGTANGGLFETSLSTATSLNVRNTLVVTEVSNLTTASCDYVNQTTANTAFSNWLNGFSVSDGCTPQFTTTPASPTAPSYCGGSTTVTWNVADNCYPSSQHTATFTITPMSAPVITLTGSASVELCLGDSYSDAGATATDHCGTNLTGSIVVSGATINTTIPNTYNVTYNVTDRCSHAATQVSRQVIVHPNPSFYISSSDNISCFNGSDGTITITANGGSGTGYEYRVHNGTSYSAWQTSNLFQNLPAGSYTVEIKDSKGCIQTECAL